MAWLMNVGIFLLGVGTTLIGAYIKALPSFHKELLHDNRSARTTRELQIESYFRQQGGAELLSLFKEWTAIMYKKDKAAHFTVNQYAALSERTILYGSDRTIRLVSDYQHFIYSNDEKSEHHGDTIIVYIALIISSLKNDFTGYKVNPLDVLQIKINDVDEHQPFINDLIDEIQQRINWDMDEC